MVNYRLVERPAFQVVGKKVWISGQDTSLFGRFWDQCRADGSLARLEQFHGAQPGPHTNGVTLGISCVEKDPANRAFYYMIAVETPEAPDDLETYQVPAAQWAVFECRGAIPDALVEAEIYAFTQWLPGSGYVHAPAPEMEVYPPTASQDSPCCEFWLPIEKEKPMNLDKAEMMRLTEEYGGAWGINHTRRLLQLIEIIGQGQDYDADVVWVAAHLHDWGAYTAWVQKDVDHALRSRQVAEMFLTERNYPETLKAKVLECIELHHKAGSDRSMEAILLRDADGLDFLGVVGVLRDVSKNPRDMRKAYQEIRRRREMVPGLLSLEKAQAIAAERVQEMDDLLARFEDETFGCF